MKGGCPKGQPHPVIFLWGGIGSHLNFKDVDDLSIRTGNTETVSLHAGKGAAVAENIDIGKEGMLGHGAQAAPVMVPGQFHTLYMAVVARGLPFLSTTRMMISQRFVILHHLFWMEMGIKVRFCHVVQFEDGFLEGKILLVGQFSDFRRLFIADIGGQGRN